MSKTRKALVNHTNRVDDAMALIALEVFRAHTTKSMSKSTLDKLLARILDIGKANQVMLNLSCDDKVTSKELLKFSKLNIKDAAEYLKDGYIVEPNKKSKDTTETADKSADMMKEIDEALSEILDSLVNTKK